MTVKIYLDNLCEKYGVDLVASLVDYHKIQKVFIKIEGQQVESRQQVDKRNEIYINLNEKDYEQLIEVYKEIRSLEPVIIKKYSTRIKHNILLPCFFTILGVVIAFLLSLIF